MSEHKRNSWRVSGAHDNGDVVVRSARNDLIALCDNKTGLAQQHAYLIAAAPDLLEALNLLYTAGWRALRGNPEHITAELLEKAGAAIDKATGRE